MEVGNWITCLTDNVRSVKKLEWLEKLKCCDSRITSALLNTVRHGDVLLFNCWYYNTGKEKIKKLYEEASHCEMRTKLY